jgi:hypothetical protein
MEEMEARRCSFLTRGADRTVAGGPEYALKMRGSGGVPESALTCGRLCVSAPAVRGLLAESSLSAAASFGVIGRALAASAGRRLRRPPRPPSARTAERRPPPYGGDLIVRRGLLWSERRGAARLHMTASSSPAAASFGVSGGTLTASV